MAKKKNEEKSEEQKRALLAKMAQTFLNEASDYDFSASDMTELAIRLAYVMVRFSYLVNMPKDMSEEKKNKASEIATMVYMPTTAVAAKRHSVRMGYPTAKQRRLLTKDSLT